MAASPRVRSTNLSDSPFLSLLTPISVHAPVEQRVRFALHTAILAPSLHNSQPWRFEIVDRPGPYVDVLLDTSREIRILDPDHRQLVISCGAAIAAFEIGLRGCGLSPLVDVMNDPDRPDLLARVHVHDFERVDEGARAEWRVLLARRTYRGRVTSRRLSDTDRTALAAAAHGAAELRFIPAERFADLERLVLRASVLEACAPGLSEEIRDWTRERERASDGVPARNWQRTSAQSTLAPVVQRDFAQDRAVPDGVGDDDEAVPELAALLTPGDTRRDWLAAGRALLAVALTAQQRGLVLGYVNQPTEVADPREELAALLHAQQAYHREPQLLLRLGYPADPLPPPPPRRPVHDVLVCPDCGLQHPLLDPAAADWQPW